MDNFLAAIGNDPALKQEFFEYMHGEEKKFEDSFKVVYENLNKQAMGSIKAFAEQKGFELEDSEAVKQACAEKCRSAAADLNKTLLEIASKTF